MNKPEKPVVVLFGPTAVGKTDLSIDLAERIDAEIISVDSRLLYKGMDIGTAKPPGELMQRVRHHLINVAEPTESWSLSNYLEAVKESINDIHARGKVPLLVGGTGQYFAGLIEGWQPPPKADDPGHRSYLQAFAEQKGHQALHAKLKRVDPVSAERIDARNIRRVIRALEIFHVTGIPASAQRKSNPPEFSFLILGLEREREVLYRRIDERIDRMLSDGWIEEVAELLEQGVEIESPAFSAIGYRQFAEHLEGKRDLESAVIEVRKVTRQFVRRQANWFRRFEPEVHWFDAGENEIGAMASLVLAWLNGEGSD